MDTDSIAPFDNKATKILRSTIVSRRISAQAGVFSVHKISEDGKIYRFETTENYKNKLDKFNIPHSNFAGIREQLHVLGVNNSALFPDLDGYCKHLEWRYSYYTDEIYKENTLNKAPADEKTETGKFE